MRNNERTTSDTPRHWTNTVWVFGSSTVWGAFVADGWTIPSYLQRELNVRGRSWRVVNMGQPGLLLTVELYWLKRKPIRPGDTVIFLDGQVDYEAILIETRRDETAASAACSAYKSVSLELLHVICAVSTMGDLLRQYLIPRTDTEFARYWATLNTANAYAKQHGARFWHFLQPVQPQPYPALYTRFGRGDPQLVIRDDEYFDTQHYDDNGHARIAEQIADYILGF